MKQNRSLLLLLLAFIILAGIALVQNQSLSTPRPVATAVPSATSEPSINLDQRIFADLDASAIVAWQVMDPLTQATMTFTRLDENLWESLEVGIEVDQQVANQLTFTAAVLPYLRILPDVGSERYAEYGLTVEDAYLLLSILLEDNSQHAVLIGDVTPERNGHYALVDDRTEVYVLDARPVAFLTIYLRQFYDAQHMTPSAN